MANGRPLTLQLWDTAGQEDYDRLRPLSYPQTDVFLVCYSLVNPESLTNAARKWVPEVRLHCPDAKIVLVGCKSDLRDTPKYVADLEGVGKSVVDEVEVSALATRLRVPSLRCSALTQRGLKEVFDTGIREAITPPPPPKPSAFAQALKAFLHLDRAWRPRSENRGCRQGPKKAPKADKYSMAVGMRR